MLATADRDRHRVEARRPDPSGAEVARRFMVVFCAIAGVFASVRSEAAPVDLTVGTTGIGLHYTAPLGNRLGARALITATRLDMNVLDSVLGDRSTDRGVDYEFSFSGYNFGAVVDFFPFAKRFRVSFGLVATRPRLSFDSEPVTDSYSIGSSTYITDDLVVAGSTALNRMGPYLSMGWMSRPTGSRGPYFTGELGVIYVGTPRLRLDATGTVRRAGSSSAEASDARSSAEFLADLETERRRLESSIERFQFWPILTLGAGYRF